MRYILQLLALLLLAECSYFSYLVKIYLCPPTIGVRGQEGVYMVFGADPVGIGPCLHFFS